MLYNYAGLTRDRANFGSSGCQPPTDQIEFFQGEARIIGCEVVDTEEDCNQWLAKKPGELSLIARSVFIYPAQEKACCDCPDFEEIPHVCPHIARALVEYGF